MTYQRILVPVDGSRTSNAGLREAVRLAKGQGAELRLVHVADPHTLALMGMEGASAMDRLMAGMIARGRRILRAAERAVRKEDVEPSSVLLESLAGPAAGPIVRQAKRWGADLIVMGTHGRRGVRRLLMGSDAEQVLRASPAPVLLVRAPGRDHAARPAKPRRRRKIATIRVPYQPTRLAGYQ